LPSNDWGMHLHTHTHTETEGKGFVKYAAEMGSGALTYIHSFIDIG
jgi:hypothetical protein